MEDSQKSKLDRFAIESRHIRRTRKVGFCSETNIIAKSHTNESDGRALRRRGSPVFAFPEPVRFRDLSGLTQKWKPPTPRLTGQQPSWTLRISGVNSVVQSGRDFPYIRVGGGNPRQAAHQGDSAAKPLCESCCRSRWAARVVQEKSPHIGVVRAMA